MAGITASIKTEHKARLMAKAVPALQPVEIDCADEGLALEMARWLTHLRAERRLSPKTLEAYARDLRQCLTFLSQHWGDKVTLKRFAGGAISTDSSSQAQRVSIRHRSRMERFPRHSSAIVRMNSPIRIYCR